LPTFKVDDVYLVYINQKKEMQEEYKCVICMSEFEIGHELKTIPCCKFKIFNFNNIT